MTVIPEYFCQSKVWPAPAKINRFLHVTGRRADGYHELQTLFQFVDLSDELRFVPRRDGRIIRHGSVPGLAAEEDLTIRAARILQEYSQVDQGVDIHLDKCIPMGGGLGGGSSDAATTLVALNRIWSLGLPRDALMRIGGSLGADVPVFIYGLAAWGEGVGDKLSEVLPDEPWILLVDPGVHVDTGKVFSDSSLTRDCQSITMAGFLAGLSGNVCASVVRRRYTAVDEAMTCLEKVTGNTGIADAVRMTGTGGCFFACAANRGQAEEWMGAMPERWRAYVVGTRNRSPLYDSL